MTAPGPVSILVVDDNSAKRLALRAVLTPLGHVVVEADSGLAALRCIMAQDFAVILLDVRMPMMDGFETAALIRQRRQSEMTPIIFITAFGNDEIEHIDRYAEGAVDFIFAPVEPDVLRAKVTVFANLFIKARDLATRATDVQVLFDQLQVLTDVAPIGIFRTDADKRYVYTNPRWSEITGVPAEEAIGQHWDAVVGAEQLPEPAGATSRQGESSHRFAIPRDGAAPRIVVVTSASMPDTEGGTAGWVGTVADVTAEVGAELAMAQARDAANAASQLKSDFLANMSHEIRTPMNGVIGMAELLLETELDAHQRDYAQTVRSSGEALLAIIDDLLDFSKVEAGKLEIEDIELEVRTVVDGVLRIVAHRARAKGLELVAAVDDSVPEVVRGDPGRLRQVLTNLVGNAVKFTQAGEIVVRVTAGEPSGSDIEVRFEVSDTGDGIDDAKLDLIFEPFVQADSSTSRRYGGTGLGLAISSRLVTLMGGESGVSSELGVGSTFWFTVYVHAAAGPGEAGPDRPDEHGTGATGEPPAPEGGARVGRLLLAEDNLVNQKVAVAMLSGAGYQVDTVLDGRAAVDATAAERYDAVLMDCQMPVLNGYEATAAIRARDGDARRTPVIALTAGARAEDRARCMAEGMDGYLSKPLRKEALLSLVDQFVPREVAAGGSPSPAPAASPPATNGRDGAPALDARILHGLERLGAAAGEDLVGQLTVLFLADAGRYLAALRRGIRDLDTAEVSRSAHTLAGASANVGATELGRLCAVLAEDESGDPVAQLAQLEALEAELATVRSALASWGK